MTMGTNLEELAAERREEERKIQARFAAAVARHNLIAFYNHHFDGTDDSFEAVLDVLAEAAR